MFPLRYWASRFFASRYWPKFGAEPPAVSGDPIQIVYAVPGAVARKYQVAAPVSLVYDPNGES
jgi:hypothetical protein